MRLVVTHLPRFGSGFCSVTREVMGHSEPSVPRVAARAPRGVPAALAATARYILTRTEWEE